MEKFLYKCSNCGQYFLRDKDCYEKDHRKMKLGIKPDAISCSDSCSKRLMVNWISSRYQKDKPKIYHLNIID